VRTPGRIAVAAVAVLAVAVAVAVLVTTRSPHPPPRDEVSRAQADALARRACELTALMLAEIDADGTTRTVLDLSDRARDAAGDAEYGSPRWVLLAGAVQSLNKALHTDDARLAATGMQQIGPACGEAGVTVRRR
jgi:hypothetical protein